MSVKKISLFLGALVLAVIWSWQSFFFRPEGLIINFFDVGQGDAIFIQTPEGEDILIDGGPDKTILEKLPQTMSFFDREIDAVILTHPHADHLVGLLSVLERYKVKQIYSTGVLHTTDDFLKWLELIKEQRIPFKIVKAGDKIALKEIALDVLWPLQNLQGQKVESLNNSSIVLKFNYQSVKVLLTGDIERAGEEYLEKSGLDLTAQILKVSHHGSAGSTHKSFLQKVKPELAVISVGKKNRYGHPSPRVLRRLKDLGVKIWRTDKQKDLKIEINKGAWKIIK